MASTDVLGVVDSVIESLQPGALSEEAIHSLHALFPNTLVLAAFDLIDREKVIKYTTSWGHTHYEVLGSTVTYSVFVDLLLTPMSYYCSCPAFSYAVMISGTHLMCKHVLATRIARRMSLCIERPTTQDELASFLCHLYS